MTKILCKYPECKTEHHAAFDVEILNRNKEIARIPFCHYHWYIVSNGEFMAVEKTVDDGSDAKIGDISIIGPLKEVQLIEQVMAAREITKIKNDLDSKNKKTLG